MKHMSRAEEMYAAKMGAKIGTYRACGDVMKRQYQEVPALNNRALCMSPISMPSKVGCMQFERKASHYHGPFTLGEQQFKCSVGQSRREPGTFCISRGLKRDEDTVGVFDYSKDLSGLAFLHFISFTSSAGASMIGDDPVIYDAEKGSDTLKTLGGTAYIVLVIFYVVWVLKKRADRATSERISSTTVSQDLDDISDLETEEHDDRIETASLNTATTTSANDQVTPVQCFIGFAQAGVICYLLYLLSTATDSFFATKELPTQYTARNIAILIQTVVRGLAYLITFIFGANALGLASLGVALILAPDWVQNQNGRSNAFGKPQPELPKVKVTDDIFAIRRAFKEAEEMGRNREQGKK